MTDHSDQGLGEGAVEAHVDLLDGATIQAASIPNAETTEPLFQLDLKATTLATSIVHHTILPSKEIWLEESMQIARSVQPTTSNSGFIRELLAIDSLSGLQPAV